MFIDGQLFRQRMEYLISYGYPVLSLDDAVEHLQRDTIPPGATVITIDDGFYSTWRLAVPVLVELGLPATIYLTTYASVRETPIFRLVVQYMFWKTGVTALQVSDIGLPNGELVQIESATARDEVAWRIIRSGEAAQGEEARVTLCRRLGAELEVDYEEIVQQRMFTLMTLSEAREAVELGVDLQLHTHRHRIPTDPDLIRREIEDNRRILEPVTGDGLYHFCYPSGIHDPAHLELLAELHVKSATTCEVGLNRGDTNPLLLNRFLDGNTISWLEFEAEMSGFAEILRRCRTCLRSGLRIGFRRRRPDPGAVSLTDRSRGE
jgi:peptidoglycan/xylan/chitin deacetylase (PgdA/CDA1 family)